MAILDHLTRKYTTAQRKETTILNSLIPLFIGSVFVLIGVVILFTPNDRTAATQGVVRDIETIRTDDGTMYSPVIEYEVDGSQYSFVRSVRTSGKPKLGDSYQVEYDPADPSDGAVAKSIGTLEFWGPVIFLVLGLIVVGVIAYGLFRSHQRTKEIERLQTQGQRRDGVLLDVVMQNGMVKSGKQTNKPEFQLVVAATDLQGEVKNYTSDVLVGVPGGLIGLDLQSAAVPIDVYIDPTNEEKYYVDLSDIPELTPERIQQMITNAQTLVQPTAVSVPHTLAQSIVPEQKPVNPQLLSYVQQQRAAGYADQDIVMGLRKAGWAESDVQAVMAR